MKILVVEDEASLARDIQNFFQQDQTRCEIATNYEEACQKVLLYPFDCILLDIGLPDENGLKLLRDLKKEGKEDGVLNNYSASVGKEKLDLTRKEFELLQHLIANHNRVLSKVSLAEYVWGASVD